MHFPSWQTLRVVGPDAASWLNGIVTCNVLSVTGDRGAWGALLTKQGKVFAELQIVGSASELFIAVSGGDASDVREVLDGYLVMEDAEIETSDQTWVIGSEPSASLLRGADVSPASISWTDEPLFIAHAPATTVEGWRATAANEKDVLWFNEWKIRHGVPTFGLDYDEKDNLHAASLERRTVDWQKGCYLGQEVVCMQDMRGKVKKRLVRLLGDASSPVPPGALLSADDGGEPVGRVTSSAGEVAIATVAAPFFEPGTRVRAGIQAFTVAALLPE